MATKFKLIKEAAQAAHREATLASIIQENFKYFATKQNTTSVKLAESITHVLAGLSQTAKNMNPNSVASLLAGVEQLATALTSSQDNEKKQNTIRALSAAAMKHDSLTNQSLPNESVVAIARHGAKFPDLVRKYAGIIGDPQQLNAAARKLLSPIERAMNVQAPQQSPQQSPQQTVATNPAATAGTQ